MFGKLGAGKTAMPHVWPRHAKAIVSVSEHMYIDIYIIHMWGMLEAAVGVLQPSG